MGPGTKAALADPPRDGLDPPEPEAAVDHDRLLQVIGVLDLTSLTGQETPAQIQDLCRWARAPVPDSVRTVGPLTVAAVCVLPPFVPQARRQLEGSPVRVATVAGGFPRGEATVAEKAREIRDAVDAGAQEVDAVVDRRAIHAEAWNQLRDEVEAFRDAAGSALLKTILGTGELASDEAIERASTVCLRAGADFLKTSTGFEEVNATHGAGIAMSRALRAHADRTGWRGGLKAAGGIRVGVQALEWLDLASRWLGPDWIRPERFRIGASSLLDDLARTLGSGDS